LRFRHVDPTMGPFFDSEFYTVSTCPPLGFDANLPARSAGLLLAAAARRQRLRRV